MEAANTANTANTASPAAAAGERSRRITACAACQKHKVRCANDGGRSACRRCLKRGVRCVFKKDSLPPSHDSPISPLRAAMVRDLQDLHAAVNELRTTAARDPLPPLHSISQLASAETPEPRSRHDLATEMLDEPSSQVSRAQSPSQDPIRSLYKITRLRSLRSKRLPAFQNTSERSGEPADLISRGVLALADAENLTRIYLSKPDYYLYGIAGRFEDLESIRRASSLLLLAICTVSALHDSSSEKLYSICFAELRYLVSNYVFTATGNLEDFRGLCIASFWLSDISWTVSGLAIRRAVEFDLQSSYGVVIGSSDPKLSRRAREPPTTKADAIECLRLWYLLCICDQHLAILYGRPATIEAKAQSHDWEAYLNAVQTENAECGNMDVRIVSQIALLAILNKVTKLFGTDISVRISTVFKPQLEDFIHQLDQWVVTWLSRSQIHPEIGDFPSKAVTLHFYFAKLFVCSHVVRGLTSDSNSDSTMESFRDITMMAVASARSVVTFITEDPDMKMAFVGLPHYFHTMIAFSCSFLLKITTEYRRHISIEAQPVFDLIARVIHLCKTAVSSPHHLIHWMGEGLHSLLNACQAATTSRERRQRTAEDQCHFSKDFTVDTSQSSLAMPFSASSSEIPHSETYADSMQHSENVWDVAREAALTFAGERSETLDDYTYPTQGFMLPADDTSNQLDTGLERTSDIWNVPLASFDIEHMGFGLL